LEIFDMMDLFMNSAWQGIMSLVAWGFRSLGLAGILVIAGGLVLLASLSVNAMRFLSRPRGMAVSAALFAAGLAFVWWTWPTADAATATPGNSGPPTLTQPEGQHAIQEPVAKTAELSKLVQMPKRQPSLPWPEPMPVMPMTAAPQAAPVLMPMIAERVPTPHPVTPPKHTAPHKPGAGQTTLSEGHRSPVGSMRPGRAAANPGRASGNAARPNAGFGPASTPPLTPKQQLKRANENYNRQADREFQYMYGNMMRGFIPAGPHVGGMGGHMGGMGHMGGHHR
jgi:hypothetical protein